MVDGRVCLSVWMHECVQVYLGQMVNALCMYRFDFRYFIHLFYSLFFSILFYCKAILKCTCCIDIVVGNGDASKIVDDQSQLFSIIYIYICVRLKNLNCVTSFHVA